MQIGLSYDLKEAVSSEQDRPDDALEEYDSPATVELIAMALEEKGHSVVKLGGGTQFLDNARRERVDIVFNISEGRGIYHSREAQIPSILEMLDIPYTGSDPMCLAVCLDKPVTKKLVAADGIVTPKWLTVASMEELSRTSWDKFPLPAIVKPAYEGSSKGIRLTSLVYSAEQAQKEALKILECYKQPVMVEEFIDGDEVTVGIIGNNPPKIVGIMRVVPRKKEGHFIYSLDVKRDYLNLVDYECPAHLDPEAMEKLAESSLKVFKSLGCRDFARVDFRVSLEGIPYFIEINPLPGLGTYSDLIIMAKMMGWTHQEVIDAVLDAALERYPQCVRRVAIVYNEPIPSRYDTAGEEKAVSGVLDAVNAVRRSLLELGHGVTCVPLKPPFERAAEKLGLKDADLVFNLFEGFCGQPETETLVPEYLDDIGISFTGCPATALGLCLDKAKVKVLLQAARIPTPDFQLLNPETLHAFHLGYPCIVKPRRDDASHGINEASVVSDSTSLLSQVQLVSGTYGDALVEEFIEGREFNATVLGNSQCIVLPVSEIAYSLPPEIPEILTFAAKWEPDSPYFRGTQVVCPAKITVEERENINELVLAAFRLLGCRGYARVDMRMDREGRLNIIEVNPNPDISPDAGTARQAKAAGMTYTRFIEKIVKLALEKEDDDSQNPPNAVERQDCIDENTAGYARVQTV